MAEIARLECELAGSWEKATLATVIETKTLTPKQIQLRSAARELEIFLEVFDRITTGKLPIATVTIQTE